MTQVNMFDAKTNLSKLVKQLEDRQESEIIISRNGKPVAKLVPIDDLPTQQIGIAKGLFTVPDNFDELDKEIASLFYGGLK